MAGKVGQARPAGRDPRIAGDPTLSARRVIVFLMALGLLVQGLVVSDATAQTGRAPRVVHQVAVEPDSAMSASRDSLMQEIRRYSRVIANLRDSLKTDWQGDIELSEDEQERLRSSIGDLTSVIEGISQELGRLELDVSDNRISFVDEAGDGIVITIPENLDERISEGFQALSEVILAELPDTLNFDTERSFAWTKHWPGKPPVAQRKVVQGNVIKVWDDLYLPWGEEVRGNVIVVFGDSEVQGRVDGNVVVVGGNLHVVDSAEVTGRVVAIGSRMDQDRGADLNDVFVLDPFDAGDGLAPLGLLGDGARGFFICQGLFVLMLVVALVAAAAAPDRRFRNVLSELTNAPVRSLGVGVVAALAGHILAAVLVAVLVLTVIGVPLALLVWLALLVAGVVATAVAATTLGERLCRRRDGGCPSPLVAVAVGMVLLHLVSFLGSLTGMVAGPGWAATILSVLGATIKVGAYLFGLGALVLSRFGAGRKPAEPLPVSGESSTIGVG